MDEKNIHMSGNPDVLGCSGTSLTDDTVSHSENEQAVSKALFDADILDLKVEIPDEEDSFINFRKLWAFTGPGFLMSIAYLDPGNIESDLQSGAMAKYGLIWVLLGAHILGLYLQRLSANIGIVAGKDMAEVAYSYYKAKVPRWILWIMMELAIIGSDMQEVIGTAIALYLLSDQVIPLWAGVLITICDTFTFLFLDKYGVRKFEFVFCFLISVMAVTFGYEFVKSKPPGGEIAIGAIFPWCSNCNMDQILMAVSVIGAVIMPHNLYLHSALVKSRNVDRTKRPKIVEARKYNLIESGLALTCSFIINLLVVSVFANGMYGRSNADIRESCYDNHNDMPHYYLDIFKNNTDTATADIFHAGVFLGCTFGAIGLYIWAAGILAAGQSSTMTGTYAGQFVMEGFLQIKIARWKRLFITRSLAILPTIIVTLFSKGVDHISGLNDLLNCIQMFQLPFSLLPCITFSANAIVMREFVITSSEKVIVIVSSAVIIAINYFFLFEYILESYNDAGGWIVFGLIMFFYTIFVLYVLVYCLSALGFFDLPQKGKLAQLFPPPDEAAFDAPWHHPQP